MPSERTVRQWAADDRDSFGGRYARARDLGLDAIADEILEIADDGRNDRMVSEDGRQIVDHDHIARSRLRVDSRKWYLSKLAPKDYGDAMQLRHANVDGSAPAELVIRWQAKSSRHAGRSRTSLAGSMLLSRAGPGRSSL